MIDIISRRKEESGFGEGRGEAEGMQGGAKNKVDLVENEQDEGKFQQRRSFNHKEGIWEFYRIKHVLKETCHAWILCHIYNKSFSWGL